MLSEKPWQPDAVLLLIAGLLLSLAASAVVSQGLLHLSPGLGKADRTFVQMVAGTLTGQGAALVLIHFFARWHRMSWRELLGLDRPGWRRAVGWGLLTGVFVVPSALLLNNLSVEVLQRVFHIAQPERQMPVVVLEQTTGAFERVWIGFAAIVLAPVVEEILFRGILYPVLKQWGRPLFALALSSLLFAASHVNLMTFVPLVFLAVVLTWLYEKTDTLAAPITTHAFFNAVNFFLLIYGNELTEWSKHWMKQ